MYDRFLCTRATIYGKIVKPTVCVKFLFEKKKLFKNYHKIFTDLLNFPPQSYLLS